ncbi:hypothetical protein LPJ78_002392 [Coemansia sp. RSA 989]|nr:hypothetical protein BX667DRAFT_505742 [Coemansia mojavensis]KAJ1742415.1 hypothetical protein LPJ68_001924 [Coemansia sp. RSA 1086]KAJ1865799.1 hypothetical protein LPJ78_002392 [Coemansia sp. RSA 989]KAJ1875190.1 hypothetical protein LPJ55_000862 [Coemansia sp. RSA 990]
MLSAAGTEAAASDTRRSRLLRYRRWLNLRNEGSGSTGCPERYDANMGLASPPSDYGDLAGPADTGTDDGSIYQQPLVQLMNGRWSGCLGPTLSNRSLSSRQGLRARASVLAASRYCPRPVTATHVAGSADGGHVPPSCSAEASPAAIESDEEQADTPLSPVSLEAAEAAREQLAEWNCPTATAPELPDSEGSQHSEHDSALSADEYGMFGFPAESAFAEYATESVASDTAYRPGAGLAAHVGGAAQDAPASVDSRSAIMHEMSAAQGGAGLPSASSIAQIFLVGQPTQARSARRMSRVRRASHRALLAIARALRIGKTRLLFPALTGSDQQCLSALLESCSAEAALASSLQVLQKSRNTRSPSFRMRADRVHASQAQLLLCIYTLFTQQVSAEERQSRHYRFYLPEDDQVELDRGFSESVLFAAQALARGFQIRGTESHTEALREPASMLCSVWAAVRFVLYARSRPLWDAWTRGHSGSSSEIDSLRRVLVDFDEAWVRFERDLCFAYFRLNNSQVAGFMDPNDSGDSGQVAQEEEFSLLVVLLSETLQRCLTQKLVTEEQTESMDPQLILALPRLAILHAIAGGKEGFDGLCFVEFEGTSMFWWFREYSDLCRRIYDTVSSWPLPLYELLQRMLVAEEADLVLSQTSDAVLFDVLYKDVKPAQTKTAAKCRSETMGDECSAKHTAVLDLESIIDSPRSVRSLSIDDCISSFNASYLSPYEPCLAHSRSLANSSSCLACDSSRIMPSNALPGMFDVPPLPHPSSLLLGSTEMSSLASTLPTHSRCPLAHALSPSMSMTSTRSASEERRRRMRLDACREQLRQAFVSVCTVADSLHSGPFARPFRVALELVFRMNTT